MKVKEFPSHESFISDLTRQDNFKIHLSRIESKNNFKKSIKFPVFSPLNWKSWLKHKDY